MTTFLSRVSLNRVRVTASPVCQALQLKREWSPWPEFDHHDGDPSCRFVAGRNVPHFRSATMKTIKFEDALKDYLEEMKQTGWYTKAYKAFVEANILKLVMERRPVADPNATVMDLFDATEMTEIVREAEAMTEAFMKSEIERMAREFYHRLRQIC